MQLAGISGPFSLADHGDALSWRLLWSSLEWGGESQAPLLESSLKAECSEEICDTARLKNINSQVKFQIKCLLGAECAAWLRAAVAHRPRHSGQSG